jgi:hypothetical protein
MDRTASNPTRRNVLIGVAGAAVAAVVATPLLRPGMSEGTRRLLAGNRFTRRFLSLADAGQAEWAAQAGSVFTAEGGYRLRLAGVQPMLSRGARPPDVARRSAFLAVFDVLDGMTMPAELIYTIRHREYGRLPIYLNASGDPRRMLAVFN